MNDALSVSKINLFTALDLSASMLIDTATCDYVAFHTTMEPQRFERRVYDGAPITGKQKIKSVTAVKFQASDKIRTVFVSDLPEYESGCRAHRDCFGHMCVTADGTVLPPHSMSLRSGDIATEYNKAARLVFTGDSTGYVEAVMSTNFTKNGTMRSTMSTPVAGSCRLIATPQWQFGTNCVAISENLASRMRVCRKSVSDTGLPNSTYTETSLQEGDWVIVVRPPSLHLGNTQPMQVRFWKHDCAGIHPESFSVFHGDFDGDEIQMYPVYTDGAVAECEAWEQVPLLSFVNGRKVYNSWLDESLSGDKQSVGRLLNIDKCDSMSADFISYTTVSAAQMRSGPPSLAFGEYSRNKKKHVDGMHARFNSNTTESSFVKESIRGMGDVSRQQLSQGLLGDMTRVAKVAASCFYRPANGGLYVTKRTGSRLVVNDNKTDPGSPSVRAIANLCAVAQQAALDSHRAEAHDTVSHDFISDLILGCENTDSTRPTSGYTLVEFTSDVPIKLLATSLYSWKYTSNDGIFCLCKPSNVSKSLGAYVAGAYNPVVLSSTSGSDRKTVDICSRGLSTVCNYYGVGMSELELYDVSFMFCYAVAASANPITTRPGMLDRGLGWIETLLATDYTKLPLLSGFNEDANSTTSSMFISNFDNMVEKHV